MTATGFQWYLDIREGAGTITNIVNEFTAGGHGYTGGDISGGETLNPRTLYYTNNQEISIYDFIYGNGPGRGWGLNRALEQAFTDGLTTIRYRAYAIAEPLHEDTVYGDAWVGDAVFEAGSEYALAVQKGEFAIKYYITPDFDDRAAFKAAHGNQDLITQIRFHNGLHGSRPSNPPVPLATDADIPLASVGYSTHSIQNGLITDYSLGHISCIIDHPPVPPDVSFVPFKGINNRVLILLDANVGNYYASPIILDDDDVPALAQLVIADTGDPNSAAALWDMSAALFDGSGTDPASINLPQIHYKSDDPIRKYQIFRLDTRPTSYLDFNLDTVGDGTGAQLIEVEEILAPGKRSVAASHIDTLSPNTKYYYCVRGIDVHNNFSNPTHVFEIELVDNDGQRYMTQKVIRFETVDKNVYSKTARRFILIEPSLQQLYISPGQFHDDMYQTNLDAIDPSSPSASDQDLHNAMGNGVPGEKIWDKIFKIRITSRSTGKKFDINLTFKKPWSCKSIGKIVSKQLFIE